jgi:signal recognition particle subunit SRP54
MEIHAAVRFSIRAVTHKPIKFIATGEKMMPSSNFFPSAWLRILGWAMLSPGRKSAAGGNQNRPKNLKEITPGRFNPEDFFDQLQQLKDGAARSLLNMIPGLGSQLRDVKIEDKQFGKLEAIISSMTVKERQNPRIINGSRRRRIAGGSGTRVQDINQL